MAVGFTATNYAPCLSVTADTADFKMVGVKRTEQVKRLYWGDNLNVLDNLLTDIQVKGHVKLIYIDPP